MNWRNLGMAALALGVAAGALVGTLPRALLLSAALAAFWVCLATVLGTSLTIRKEWP